MGKTRRKMAGGPLAEQLTTAAWHRIKEAHRDLSAAKLPVAAGRCGSRELTHLGVANVDERLRRSGLRPRRSQIGGRTIDPNLMCRRGAVLARRCAGRPPWAAAAAPPAAGAYTARSYAGCP